MNMVAEKPVRAMAKRPRPSLPPSHPSDSDAGTAAHGIATPLGALLAGHVLRDGEVILLAIKPSLWYILLSSINFLVSVAIVVSLSMAFEDFFHHAGGRILAVGVFVVGGRLSWAALQWMGRLYVLTNMRIMTISGVFFPDLSECPLRKVADVRLFRPVLERLLGLGSMEIRPHETNRRVGTWQTVWHPVQVQEQVVAAIRKAGQGGCATSR